jgi:hypothetical protein
MIATSFSPTSTRGSPTHPGNISRKHTTLAVCTDDDATTTTPQPTTARWTCRNSQILATYGFCTASTAGLTFENLAEFHDSETKQNGNKHAKIAKKMDGNRVARGSNSLYIDIRQTFCINFRINFRSRVMLSYLLACFIRYLRVAGPETRADVCPLVPPREDILRRVLEGERQVWAFWR